MINGYIDNQTTTGQYMDGTPEPTEAQQNDCVARDAPFSGLPCEVGRFTGNSCYFCGCSIQTEDDDDE